MKSFEITQKASFLILISILSAYVGLSFNELFVDECYGIGDCYDFDRRMARINVWDVDWIKHDFRHIVHLSLLVFSEQMFGNAKFLVLVSSTVLLVLTYLFTVKVTRKNIAGIVAVLVVLSSSIFRTYDTSVTYPSFWATLYLFTLYLTTTRIWGLASISYLISIPAKSLTALFFPATVGFVALSDYQTKKTRVRIVTMFLVLFAIGIGLLFSIGILRSGDSGGFLIFTDFRPMDFVMGFVSWMWKGFANDQITLLIMIVSSFFLLYNRKVISNANAVLLLLFLIILTHPFLDGMSTYSIWPYRELPMVIITGVMSGMLIGNYQKINFSMFLPKYKHQDNKE